MYAETIDTLSKNLKAGVGILDFVHENSKGMDEAFISFLRAVNIKTVQSTALADDQREWGRRALRTLVARDCGGTSIWRKTDHFFVETMASCKNIKKSLKVTQIAGIDVFIQGAAAYDLVRKICANAPNRTVSVGGKDRSYDLTCVELSERPNNYKILSVP